MRRGQSLVEFALTLPVLLTIVAGVLEVTNVLTIYNRVQLSAREGARFGAEGGNNSDVWAMVNQTSSESLIVVEDRMKVWSIRPTLDITDAGVWTWKDAGIAPATPWGPEPIAGKLTVVDCIYPSTCDDEDLDSIPVTPEKVLEEMQAGTPDDDYRGLDGDRFIVVIVAYQTDLLLNLPFWGTNGDGTGRFPMWSYAIMREEVREEAITQRTTGCSAFPFALNLYQMPGGDNIGAGTFIPSRTGGVGLNNPVEGAARSQGVGYLNWNLARRGPEELHANTKICEAGIPASECPYVRGAMRWPGNSKVPGYGYENPDVPGDFEMHVGDWVIAADVTTALYALTGPILTEHESTNPPRALQIIVYKYEAGTNPALDPRGFYKYKIYRFAVVNVVAHSVSGGSADNWMRLKFVRWGDLCGQTSPAP